MSDKRTSGDGIAFEIPSGASAQGENTPGTGGTAPGVAPGVAKVPEPESSLFHCASCGHEMSLPAQLLGRQAKCPKCGVPGVVERPRQQRQEPDEQDVRLDDLVADAPDASAPKAPKAPETPPRQEGDPSLALEAAVRAESFADHARLFFAGNFPLNVLSGLLGGVHLSLGCLAFALLFALMPALQGVFPHALWLMLLPAVFGTVIFALHGQLRVALGAPEPAIALALMVLAASVAGDLHTHVSPEVIRATVIAAVALAALVAGVVCVLVSRLGVGERVRYLPPEVVGGLLAGFGLLLVKAWAGLVAGGDPVLGALLAQPLGADWAAGLTATVWTWAPALGFGLLCFVIQMSSHSLLWPLLAAACATGAWHAVQLYTIPALGGLATHIAALPAVSLSLEGRQLLALADPVELARINWAALGGRLEFFVAVAALSVTPSLVRASVLEVRQGRDVDPEAQLRMMGAASMLSGALGGLPASLSLSGSLGMRALGAAGPIAGLVAALTCLGFALAGQSVLPAIPLFVPLGLLLSISLLMPVSWLLRDARNPLSSKADIRLAWVACLGTLALGPVLGILCSLGLGLAVSLRRAVSDGGVRFQQKGSVYHSNVDRSPAQRRVLRELGDRILVLRLRGYLFLGTFYALIKLIRRQQGLRYVLLDFGAVTGLGATAAIGLQRLEQLAREGGMTLFFTSLPLEMEEHLEALGYRMGEEGLCRIALNLDYALEWCEDDILREAGAAEEGHEVGEQGDALEELLAATFPEPRLLPVLMKCLERVEVGKKKPVFHQGDESDAMYFLQSGKVHVELTLPGGKPLRLKKMGPGTVFGEMGLYTSAPRSASVVAMEKCVLYKLTVERFKLVQAKAPQLAAAVNRYVVGLLAERVAEENAKTRANQL